MPFVVTVAVGTVSACGGSVSGSNGSNLDEGDSGTQELEDGSTLPPLHADCPTNVPVTGQACAVKPNVECHYDPASPCDPRLTMQCDDGTWITTGETWVGSCNPPPPPTRVCPANVPIEGDYCDYQGPPCEYALCYGATSHSATCVNYAWRLAISSCNPPPPACPPVKPQPGTLCSNYEASCTYGNRCEISYCGGGYWQTILVPGCGFPDSGYWPDAGSSWDAGADARVDGG